MKRQFVAGMAVAALLVGGVTSGWAGNGDHDRGNSRAEERRSKEGKLARMTRVLKLSDDQQAKIGQLFKEEREKSASFMEKLAENRKLLRQAVQAEKFDEAAVRRLATAQAQAASELTVIRVLTRHQVHSLLTPGQRALAEEAFARGPEGRHMGGKGKHHHCRGEHEPGAMPAVEGEV